MREEPLGRSVLDTDETCGRAAGALCYARVARTECLTLTHLSGRPRGDIDAGGVLGEFTGALVRPGYPCCEHLKQVAHG